MTHYIRDPLPLEFTMDPALFSFVDDSREKLSTKNIFLIFVIWSFGMVLGVAALLVEKILFKLKTRNKNKNSQLGIYPLSD
jgi:hypothetical protein